ncbi:hypothetical protein B0A48_01602 [Cryoendolithus antarcticus]|uniref:Uncharacterized protein n=1 Tax=Cryoendolithus antarcticus TaxID=1507870 RepID=A0A1V8TPY3_9PEZI|nr:hypothetical protein B0A48_01602 [Cryoendolithus antarcticus]
MRNGIIARPSQHRLCFSLDERHLQSSSARNEPDSPAEEPATVSEDSHITKNQLIPVAAVAPHPQPCRVSTPDGVPSWPGASTTSFVRRQRQISLRYALIDWVHGRPGSGRNLRASVSQLFLRKQKPTSRPWRPPLSGHETFRFGVEGGHPFQSGVSVMGLENEITTHGQTVDKVAARRRCGGYFALSDRGMGGRIRIPSSNTPAREDIRGAATLPTARALTATAGIRSPSSGSVRMQTPQRGISPRGHGSAVITPSHLRSLRSGDSPHGTTRTRDLMQAFPAPPLPDVPTDVARPKKLHKRISLFPIPSSTETMRDLGSSKDATNARNTASESFTNRFTCQQAFAMTSVPVPKAGAESGHMIIQSEASEPEGGLPAAESTPHIVSHPVMDTASPSLPTAHMADPRPQPKDTISHRSLRTQLSRAKALGALRFTRAGSVV